jgi:hypothetical protein
LVVVAVLLRVAVQGKGKPALVGHQMLVLGWPVLVVVVVVVAVLVGR